MTVTAGPESGPLVTDEPSAPSTGVGAWLRTGGRAVSTAGRWLGRKWRTSLQFRVVLLTIALCTLVIAILGAYLFRAIGSGLEADRLRQAQLEAGTLTVQAQAAFDATPSPTVDDLYSSVSTYVRKSLAAPGEDNARYVILVRGAKNTNPAVLGTITTGRIPTTVVPEDLRQAISGDPTRQQTKVVTITDPQTNEVVPAVIVGSQIALRPVGNYDLYFVFPMDREQATLQRIADSFTLGGLILLLLVGAVAWVVTRQVVNPVRRAAAVAERLSAGHLNERMPSRGHDELSLLGKSFNGMADNLQTQIHQLEGLSRVQQRFVSDVSHELRTPLTTIRMAADMLYDSRESFEPLSARSAELLHTELDRFEELLADLLEISRFDAGAAALDTDPVDLAALTDKVITASASLAALKGSEVLVHRDGASTIADVDARRVERILRNLIVNALEHGDGHPVEIHFAGNEGAVAVVIEDHGVGLRPGEASLVFNRFWRADPARARTTGGTGLGLAIAQEDARLHNGWLQAWGEPGRGSRFRLTLPRKVDEPITVSPLPLGRPAALPPR